MAHSLKPYEWEEIHGFSSPNEYAQFVQYVEQQVVFKYVEELEVDPSYGKGMIYGGRWFKDVDSGQVWRLVSPDFPFMGLWEPVLR
jgi:hypothetical protein